MTILIAIVGTSGVGKTTFLHALAKTNKFQTAFEQHAERPFQTLLKQDKRYALANQTDYLLYRAEQESELRASPQNGLIDGGLDLDFHGFTRLFHSRSLLSDSEYELLRRLYHFIRAALPLPELIIRLDADVETVAGRLSTRDRINIASPDDSALFNSYLDEWLEAMPSQKILTLDVSHESPSYRQSIGIVLSYLEKTFGLESG